MQFLEKPGVLILNEYVYIRLKSKTFLIMQWKNFDISFIKNLENKLSIAQDSMVIWIKKPQTKLDFFTDIMNEGELSDTISACYISARCKT